MVDQTLDRRLAYNQRLQEVQEQHTSVEKLRDRTLPDGRTLAQADPDGSLFDTLHALVGVVRKHPRFHLDLSTQQGLRLQVRAHEGALDVEVLADAAPEPDLVVDLRDGVTPSASATISSNDDSALSAALRRQAQDAD